MARDWSAAVTLDSVDVSALVTGVIRIEAEESVSRVARFTMFPPAGVLDPKQWTGKPVTIDFIEGPDGVPVITRLFTGVVNLPVFDPVAKFIEFDCTDNLQGHFEAMDEAAILAAIVDGKYSNHVFGERQDGWDQAQYVLSTVPKGYDLNRDGVTATLADWASGAATYSYTASDIKDGSVRLDLVRLRDLVNRVVIEGQYQFTRLHHREHGFGWNYGAPTFCDWLPDTYAVATRDMIESAFNDASWRIQGGINYDTLPESGSYCTPTIVHIISEAELNQSVINAAWTGVRRWSQTITEEYTITVEDGSSVTLFGEARMEDGAGFDTEYDGSQWDASTDTATPAWTVNDIGDYAEDQTDRTVSDNALETLIQIANTKIRSSHRQNYHGVTVDLEPALERFHTVSISDGTVTSIGKVFSYTHTLDISTQQAFTELTTSISKSGTGGVNDVLTAPTPPDTQPVHAPPTNSTVLPTRIGNDDTAPNYDAAWVGLTTNYVTQKGAPTPEQVYPWRFHVAPPDIEAESRDEVTGLSNTTVNVQCPDEVLTINV